MSVLAIDVGNSRVKLGVFTQGKSQDPAVSIAHAQVEAELPGILADLWQKTQAATKENEDETSGIALASVVPALSAKIENLIKQTLAQEPVVIGRDVMPPLKTTLKDERTVGLDRVLGALAAYVNVEHACVIVQAGSALVVDCIDDEGVFRGGSIGPGLAMGAKALHQHAAQLPEVTLNPPAVATTPEDAFGRNTEEAINLGLFAGARGAVRELVERYATALGSWPHVVATGGDAQALLGESDFVDSFVPDLVLQGAALVWEHSREGA